MTNCGVSNKKKRKVVTGVIYIRVTFNNVFITIADTQGYTLLKSSAGVHGFIGSKKSTPYAASVTAESVVKAAVEKYGMKVVSIVIRGPSFGLEPVMKAIQAYGLAVTAMKDLTPIPHNGCRLRKKRRV
ncbi:30S ribosomal protein S11 [Wolbachia endosymbiont of Pentidionis agamae]|uniref:30S ribosomal protein S11 n=1 Tax=Wolbachia endosymbiont of Pentidionis agamae TaxID=3110435 RepID=UPI002FD71D8E